MRKHYGSRRGWIASFVLWVVTFRPTSTSKQDPVQVLSVFPKFAVVKSPARSSSRQSSSAKAMAGVGSTSPGSGDTAPGVGRN